jgi:hypothetical protein
MERCEFRGYSGLHNIGISRISPPHAGHNEAQSPQPRPAAALAFDDLVAFLQQALALAILALLLFLDVGAFFVGHGVSPSDDFAGTTMIAGRVLV